MGWNGVARQQPEFVIFGELHGTQQGPQFFGYLACAIAAKKQSVLIGVEMSAADDGKLQAAWNLPVDRFAGALSGIGWLGRNDGVASEAMFAMMVRLHDLKEQGFAISVVAFNGARDETQSKRFAHLPGQGAHEARQAENIALAAKLADYDYVIALVGNIHARKDTIERRGTSFDPMARRLSQYGKTVTLNMRHAGGSSWTCALKSDAKIEPGMPLTKDAISCGMHSAKGDPDLRRAPFIELTRAPKEGPAGSYDGFFWVGPISGSPPFAARR